jgi:hypothetical protein
MASKQLRLPKCGGRREDKHPRAYLFRTMELLGQAEDRALAPLEDEGLVGTAQEWDTLYAEFDRAIDQARSFYQAAIAPLYRTWWLA